jgi:hypothetical protein
MAGARHFRVLGVFRGCTTFCLFTSPFAGMTRSAFGGRPFLRAIVGCGSPATGFRLSGGHSSGKLNLASREDLTCEIRRYGAYPSLPQQAF